MNKDGLIFALALCRKAGALAVGFDSAISAANGKRAYMLIVASDASERTAQQAKRAGEQNNLPVYTLPKTMKELEAGTGRSFAIAAVTGKNQAALVEKNIKQQTEETIC